MTERAVEQRHGLALPLQLPAETRQTRLRVLPVERGKGADMGASFGGGASQTVFGSSGGGNVLTSATGWLSALFFATSFGLAMIADQQFADTDDLGFEVPLESIEAAPLAPAGDLPLADEPIENSGADDLPID